MAENQEKSVVQLIPINGGSNQGNYERTGFHTNSIMNPMFDPIDC